MLKPIDDCREELTQQGWTVYVSAYGDLWQVTAIQQDLTCVAQGEDRMHVWNAVLKKALRLKGPRA